jgi:threonylcarbamoyladenosine tRNA methylthiotransferase MtaB
LTYKRQFAGEQAEVLVEAQRDSAGKLCGYTDRYLKVVFDGPDSLKNLIVPVRLDRPYPETMLGTIAPGIPRR